MKLTHPDSAQTIDVAAGHEGKYLAAGWRVATPDAPKANASREMWAAFAAAQGIPVEDGMTRDDIRAALS